DFQFWYQQITNSNISEILQNRLHEKRRQRFDELEYNRKFNEFVEQIRQETDLNRLKNEWITKIDKSKFNDEDKNTLYDLREERIQELQPNESDDYQRI
ncbi:5742_t:CDS:1, partial [Gigaspora rosea]